MIQTLQEALQTAAASPDGGALFIYPLGNPDEPVEISYTRLLHLARQAGSALQFQPRSIVLLHFDNHWDRVLWLWASLLAGYIPVMSTPFPDNTNRRLAHLEHLSELLSSPACLTSTRMLPAFEGQESIVPTCVDRLHVEDSNIHISDDAVRATAKSPHPDATAVLMLTSGSSGSCKAVALTHEQITAAVAGKHGIMPIAPSTTFLSWVGLDHVAGLVEIHLQAIFTGHSQVLVEAPDVLMSPGHLLSLVERHRVAWTFAPNFFLARMHATLQQQTPEGKGHASGGWNLSSLQYLTSGGEANTTQMCEEVATLLSRYGAPRNVIVPGFGMTETCAGAIFNTQFPEHDKRHGYAIASLGRCMAGIQVRVTDGTGTNIPVPAGALGHLEVSGPVVFRSYFRNEEATRSSFTSDGWFVTGDLAMSDETEDGHLLLKGRVKDVLNINAVKYNPTDIEAGLYEAVPQLTYGSACCFSSLPPDGHTEEIVIVYLPSYEREDLEAHVRTVLPIRQACLEMTGSRPQVLPLSRTSVAKSSLGKLPRAQIKAAYERGEYRSAAEESAERFALFRKTTDQEPRDELEGQLLAIFIHSVDHATEDEFGVQTSILDLGITSIELIKLKRHVERDLTCIQPGSIPLSTLMRNTTVRDLASVLRGSTSASTSSAPNSTYDPVVPLQRRGSKTPIWLAHPGIGEVMAFMNLAKYFTDRPIYALRAAGFNDGEALATSLPVMVQQYHGAIKRHQPQGPYALAGYSYGGMVAFELAKLLERTGDTVRFLGSFNLPPHIKERMRQVDWKTALLDLCNFLELLSERQRVDLGSECQEISDRDKILARVLGEIDQERFAELALSPAALANWAQVGQNLHHLAVDYEPLPSVASMDVFYCNPIKEVASGKEQWFNEFISLWRDFTRSEPRFHEVQGSHYTMISPENVFRFQKTMKAALSARGL
ncbi:acetyl-CoA synthetase-like protein [Aspergillus aculeatinus CBS 121060]|uniref:Acetyl-CoA synthetase-like protein n=1 Tax=Aspergillus aculeatinus CBS 121060 TaxID=1448322 RepID=A0ACD1GSH1_9EURO|nr:acetyl-CoA synthetase-like protein [Aspergillus aculeatinus CBS 121060]RAH64223.1 acetyl-CoA synthetase-like protein [Aspergillus aculeatinus CBS 121060]